MSLASKAHSLGIELSPLKRMLISQEVIEQPGTAEPYL